MPFFFNLEKPDTLFGRRALAEYLEHTEGRLMRSLKSILGTSLMQETTMLANRRLAFMDILGYFIAHVKRRAETYLDTPIESVVLGRPVHFVDNDKAADASAQQALEQIARKQGFKHIIFQYEPIAAALDYEQDITQEELALIIDIGGGTSDFSIVRLAPERREKPERGQDVLANQGVHVGGTDFDYALSLLSVMPHLGYRSPLLTKGMLTPNHYYHDLATWHKINFLYTYPTIQAIREIKNNAVQPKLLERLIYILEEKKGHQLAMLVEQAKIELTDTPKTAIDLSFVEQALSLEITQELLHKAIEDNVTIILDTIRATLREAKITADGIHTVFLTGGSTAIPMLYQRIIALFPAAKIVEGDKLGSVGLGLAVEAKRKFG